jgi:hypothetical protein
LLSVEAFASHPFTTLPSQSRKPRRHTLVQLPPLHVVPLHIAPHVPQFSGLVRVSTHMPPQQICMPEHVGEQPPSGSASRASVCRMSRGASLAMSLRPSAFASAVPSN